MRLTFVAATRNQHKIREIRRILRGTGIVLKSLDQFPALPEVPENGRSLAANAAKKAEAVCHALGLPALSDDSGLFVPALKGLPGVRSARYAGPDCNYARNNQKLLRAMRHLHGRQRWAYFATTVAWARPGQKTKTFTGKIWGAIVAEPRGANGFGYDPVFQPQGKTLTFAQMSTAAKNKISHRALAFRKAAACIMTCL